MFILVSFKRILLIVKMFAKKKIIFLSIFIPFLLYYLLIKQPFHTNMCHYNISVIFFFINENVFQLISVLFNYTTQ